MITPPSNWQRPFVPRLLLAVALVWLGLTSAAFLLHQRAPVTDLIIRPRPGWQLQVWYGTRTIVARVSSQRNSLTTPIIMVFYETPFTGIRLLIRTTVPIWPLALSTVLGAGLTLLFLSWPRVLRRRR